MLDFVAILAAQDRTERTAHEARPHAPVQIDTKSSTAGWRRSFRRLRDHLGHRRPLTTPRLAEPTGARDAARSA